MQTEHAPGTRSEAGFTLVEVLVAMGILLVGVLAAATMLGAVSRANTDNRQRDAGVSLARDVIEAARNIPYDRLTRTGIAGELQRAPGLEDRSGAGYDVRRGKVDFTLGLDVCIVDDPADGGGPRVAGATFCSSSVAAGTADRNPEDYKRVTVSVSWRAKGGETRSAELTGIVSNPGSANGPAIRSIAPRGLTSPFVVTNPLATSVTVDIQTSSQPAAINWLLDGTVQQPPPVMNGPSGLAWAFQWQIGDPATDVLDGDYILAAEAFNQYGLAGPGRQATVILNRRQPLAPRQVTGGRTNFGTVEIEWTANRERDIAGYEVYRLGALAPVCPLATQKLETVCVDRNPPSTSPLTYWVVAYDRDPITGATRSGDLSDLLIVTSDNQAPNPPSSLTAARTEAGTVTLRWKRPSPEDPDSGDGIVFYRVYRDGQTLEHRYARWFEGSSTVTWQDTAAGVATHTYWVTAVDEHYAESTYLGPVSG